MSDSKDLEPTNKNSFMKNFEEMRPDLFLKEIYETPEVRAKAREALKTQKTKLKMFSSIPMKCAGPECIFATECPLLKKNIAPAGKKCPVEMQAVTDFMYNLMEDLNVNSENMVEVSMIRDLVDQEIQHVRKSQWQANEGMTMEQVVGVDAEGRPVIQKALHLSVELEDKILKRKKEIRNQLLASREARAKAGHHAVDNAQHIAGMMKELREVELNKERLVREKLGIKDDDEYIKAHDVEILDAEIIDDGGR